MSISTAVVEDDQNRAAGAPLAQCTGCGCTSPLVEFFRKVRGRRLLCPHCYTAHHVSAVRWVYVLMSGLAVLAVLFLLWPTGPQWRWHYHAANVVLGMVFANLLLIPHELAHAVATWLAGGRVHAIHVGGGRTIYAKTVRGVEIGLHGPPMSGYCAFSLPGRRFLRLRWSIVTAAGILFHLWTISLLLPGADYGLINQAYAVRETLLFASGAHLLISLARIRPTIEGQPIPSDGMQLAALLSPSWRAEDAEVLSYVAESLHEWRLGNLDRCLETSRRGLERFPGHPLLANLEGVALLDLGRYDEALAIFRHLNAGDASEAMRRAMPATADQAVFRALTLNNIAWSALMRGPAPGELNAACADAREAYHLIPWEPAVQGTLGVVLLESGMPREALPHLSQAYHRHVLPRHKASLAGSLALAYARLGEAEKSRHYLEVATQIAPHEPMVRRARATLAS